MSALDALKMKASRIYRLMQKSRNERRRARLRELYERCYETYRKQKLISENADRAVIGSREQEARQIFARRA